MTGAQSFSGEIVYSTEARTCERAPLGVHCIVDPGSARFSAQLDGSGPIYASDPTDPLLRILLESVFVAKFSPDDPVDPFDPDAVLRQSFAPRSLNNADVGEYEMGLWILRLIEWEEPLLYPGPRVLLEPSSRLAQELIGAGFELTIDAGGPGDGSSFGTVTHAFVIPEPATASLLLAGLAGLALAGRPRAANR